MSARRLFSLLAALVMSSPLAAAGLPECGPGPHCPMAALVAEEMPCHGAAMTDEPPCHRASFQEDDCCVRAPEAEAAEVLPVVVVAGAALDDGTPAPRHERPELLAGPRDDAPSPPLYRLFRALLI